MTDIDLGDRDSLKILVDINASYYAGAIRALVRSRRRLASGSTPA